MTDGRRRIGGLKLFNIILAGCAMALVIVCLLTASRGTVSEETGPSPVVTFAVDVIEFLLVVAFIFVLARRWNRRAAPPGWGLGPIFGKWSGEANDEFPFIATRADSMGDPDMKPRRSETPLAAQARKLLVDWRGDAYSFGLDCLDAVGEKTAPLGRRALFVANRSEWLADTVERVIDAFGPVGVEVVARCEGARPNSPLEDVYRIQDEIEAAKADVIVAAGAGSTIDATKAAIVLACLSPGVHDVNPFFGVGRVTEKLGGTALTPLVAVETAASSGSHLTKYANVTDLAAGQKKLIVDMAIVPRAAVFDYSTTVSASKDLTCDGAFDGMSHCIEVYYGAKGDALEKVERIALTGVSLIVSSVADAVRDPGSLASREALGLGTDLGGYAIVVGSTSGGHLTSFSLVDVTTHGRATAILNPYYTVLFAPAIERQLRKLSQVYVTAGLMSDDASRLSGRDLALAVAEAMMALSRQLGYPTSLGALPGFGPFHIDRAIAAAKDPQLKMKLQAMPVPMDAVMVDKYMRPVLKAAAEGDIRRVVTMK